MVVVVFHVAEGLTDAETLAAPAIIWEYNLINHIFYNHASHRPRSKNATIHE